MQLVSSSGKHSTLIWCRTHQEMQQVRQVNSRCFSLFIRYGRVNFVLASRLDLLKEVQRLQVSGQLFFVLLYFERQNLL